MKAANVSAVAEVVGRPSSPDSASEARLYAPAFAAPRTWFLVASLGLYLALAGAILLSSDFVPYGTDNNESFSMWIHARNMLRFGVWHAAGLSDEANSPQPAAHPYVYTHEGNFPRFFIYLLMQLGITRVEWQIAISAALIGGGTIYLCFRFFSRLGSDLFAFLACAVFATDYLLFMQWEVNTFRVWHGFLFFLSLVCVQALGARKPVRTGALLLLTAVALFYFEIVFAFFTAAMCVCYALLAYWRQWRVAVVTAASLGAGALVALGGLFAQSAVHLGWATARRDIELTFLSRNFYDQTAAGSAPFKFYMAHHIVYWVDQPSTRGYLNLETFLHTVGAALRIDTPYLLLLVWVLVAAWICRQGARVRLFLEPHGSSAASSALTRRWAGLSRLRIAWPVMGAGALSLGVFYAAVSIAARSGSRLTTDRDAAQYAHMPGFPLHWLAPPSLSVVTTTVVIATLTVFGALTRRFPAISLRWYRGVTLVDADGLRRWSIPGLARIPWQSLVLAVVFLYIAGQYELFHWRLYDTDKAALWLGAITGYFPDRLLQGGLLGTVLLGLLMILDGGRQYLPLRRDRFFVQILLYVLAGVIAFAILYAFFPGYLWAGYLSRYAPLPVFLIDVWIALFFYILVVVAWSSCKDLMSVARRQASAPRVHARKLIARPHLVLALSVLMLVLGSVYWARVQSVYVSALPPTDYLFARQLARPPYKGATIVSNNYAAPITYYTGTWAYEDPTVEQNRYVTGGGRLAQVVAGYYLWEADRSRNIAYARPQYYVCIANPDLTMATALVALRPRERLTECSRQQLIRDALDGGGALRNEVVARDPSPRDMWAIVKLDPSIRLVSPNW